MKLFKAKGKLLLPHEWQPSINNHLQLMCITNWVKGEWLGDCWLTPCASEQFFSDVIYFVLDQYAKMEIYSAISLKQQSADRHFASLW